MPAAERNGRVVGRLAVVAAVVVVEEEEEEALVVVVVLVLAKVGVRIRVRVSRQGRCRKKGRRSVCSGRGGGECAVRCCTVLCGAVVWELCSGQNPEELAPQPGILDERRGPGG